MGFALGALSAGAVQTLALSIDGREVAREDFGAGCTVNCQIMGEVRGLSSGSHTVVLTVVRQSRASVRYRVIATALHTDLSTGVPRPIDLEDQTLTLQAGQAVSYSVSL